MALSLLDLWSLAKVRAVLWRAEEMAARATEPRNAPDGALREEEGGAEVRYTGTGSKTEWADTVASAQWIGGQPTPKRSTRASDLSGAAGHE